MGKTTTSFFRQLDGLRMFFFWQVWELKVRNEGNFRCPAVKLQVPKKISLEFMKYHGETTSNRY